MEVAELVPTDLDTLKDHIVRRYEDLSPRLQQVADFAWHSQC